MIPNVALVIFLVSRSTGEHEDRGVDAVKAFSCKEDAQEFCNFRNNDVAQCEGLLLAVNNMLEVWDKSHPMPPYGGEDSYEARDLVASARQKEEDRLREATGYTAAFKELLGDAYSEYRMMGDVRNVNYFVTEVPMG